MIPRTAIVLLLTFAALRPNTNNVPLASAFTTPLVSSINVRIRHRSLLSLEETTISSPTDNATPINSTATPPNNVGIFNRPGKDPDRAGKVNQDAHFHLSCHVHNLTKSPPAAAKNVTFVGVMDGHGTKGHVVTTYLRERLPFHLAELSRSALPPRDAHHYESRYLPPTLFRDRLSSILAQSFELSHDDARHDPNVPAGRSGTTCVVAAHSPDTDELYVANVGDSRAVLFCRRRRRDGGGEEWGVVPLSETTTTASRVEERRRIENGEGRIDGNGNVWYGPVGIAMTRALGDAVMLRAGVVPTPEVGRFGLR
eukprot:CAMPEP_0172516784 /NCGR_PEP_ID=MMETSP1066-20121228/279080_1 /TAXON_ID=671091 /ORGANISM="Coscinodiscus wailesii, Strain CCMP2513" /LENGTH=311 /DNA_ID=CAMNT_0013298415 /DNA_START=59 /DNA_END=991 /DNA_ORIENTATION=-